MRYRIADEFDTNAADYWEMFFGEDYNDGLWPAIRMAREQLSLTREGEGESVVIRREQLLTPSRELPAFMKKFVKGAFSYRELDVFTARDNRMELTTIPSLLPDKLTSTGVYSLEPLGDNRVLRVFEGECVCRVPLLGSKIEKELVNEIQDSYRKTTVFTRGWLARNTTA